jgi:hypothetical protein
MTSERRNKHKPGQIVAKLRDATASVITGCDSKWTNRMEGCRRREPERNPERLGRVVIPKTDASTNEHRLSISHPR